ncbi:MAG: DUF4489 domain-containing protein [Clostridium argentinense]|nr:DUF4489 domain-containing protein [Clostridium argentinense]
MNSKFRSFKNEYCKCDPYKCAMEKKLSSKDSLSKSMLLSYNTGNGVCVSSNTPTPITLVSTTIDTTCLCEPIIKIDFNSIINYQAVISDALEINPFALTFELSKYDINGTKISLGSWAYSTGLLSVSLNITNSFNFTYSEFNTHSGCYTYTVDIIKITDTILFGEDSSLTEKISIINSNISVLASSSN